MKVRRRIEPVRRRLDIGGYDAGPFRRIEAASGGVKIFSQVKQLPLLCIPGEDDAEVRRLFAEESKIGRTEDG